MRSRYRFKVQSLEGQQAKENQKWLNYHLTECQKVLGFAPIPFLHIPNT